MSVQPADVFISHASEDSDDIARPLAEALRRQGFVVWYDEYILRLGDSLRQVIDKGLSSSRFGVVILSPSFFIKEWPQRELNGLLARESANGAKVLLPIWHRITFKEVVRFSPLLADKFAVSTDRGLEVVVRQIVEVIEPGRSIRRPEPASHPPAPPQREPTLPLEGQVLGRASVWKFPATPSNVSQESPTKLKRPSKQIKKEKEVGRLYIPDVPAAEFEASPSSADPTVPKSGHCVTTPPLSASPVEPPVLLQEARYLEGSKWPTFALALILFIAIAYDVRLKVQVQGQKRLRSTLLSDLRLAESWDQSNEINKAKSSAHEVEISPDYKSRSGEFGDSRLSDASGFFSLSRDISRLTLEAKTSENMFVADRLLSRADASFVDLEAQQVTGAESAYPCIIIREREALCLSRSGYVLAYRKSTQSIRWKLKQRMPVTFLRSPPDVPNRLTVIKTKGYVIFFVNGKEVCRLIDSWHKLGKVGLGILFEKSGSAEVNFFSPKVFYEQ